MKTAAIICEYNPFHNGHKYQIDKAREILGEDTRIIAVMSGNFTQRGEVALTDKSIRAKAAVLSGVNLVLELPFPYSMSSAEFFAFSGVDIINKLACVDYLVFGCEAESTQLLCDFAEKTSTEEFNQKLVEIATCEGYKDLGYPKLFSIAYNELYGEEPKLDISLPNNILAVEYLRAIKKSKSNIKPLAILRKGGGYNDGLVDGTSLQSASAIRGLIEEKDESAFDYIPSFAKEVFYSAYKEGLLPADAERLSSAVISYFRLNPPTEEKEYFDAVGGLYNRVANNSFATNSISSLTLKTETKRYTRARIRRAIWNSYFGVTSSEIRTPPAFTRVLALDTVGQSILKGIPKRTDFHIFTKPTEKKDFSEQTKKQKELSDKVDSVYAMCFEKFISGHSTLTTSPFVKKQ